MSKVDIEMILKEIIDIAENNVVSYDSLVKVIEKYNCDLIESNNVLEMLETHKITILNYDLEVIKKDYNLSIHEATRCITPTLDSIGSETLPENDEGSIDKALEILGGKWTILIIRDLRCGTKRFGELRNSLVGVSPKTLSERLKELVDYGIVNRTAFATIPPSVEYDLTEKGMSLHPILQAMELWGSCWG